MDATMSSVPTTESATALPAAPLLSCLPQSLHDAKAWPQYPLLLRANAHTRVLGIRFSNATNYLWTPASQQSWLQLLHQEWKEQQPQQPMHVGFGPPQEPVSMSGTIANAANVILPVNNGNEALGQALVTDFETDLFRGAYSAA